MADLIKLEVSVPAATAGVLAAGKVVAIDILKALEDGWQPWNDVSVVVNSVIKNLVPVAGNVGKVPAEFLAYPAESAKLAGLALGELVGFALKKVRG